jgi:uncharacterized membrane protein
MEEHMKPILTSIATGSLLAALAIAQPAPRYAVTDLGAVGGAPGQPWVITNNGLVSGAAATPGAAMHAVLWYKGLKIDIGTPGLTGLNSAAYGVNELGQTVGTAQTSVPNSEDFLRLQRAWASNLEYHMSPFLVAIRRDDQAPHARRR